MTTLMVIQNRDLTRRHVPHFTFQTAVFEKEQIGFQYFPLASIGERLHYFLSLPASTLWRACFYTCSFSVCQWQYLEKFIVFSRAGTGNLSVIMFLLNLSPASRWQHVRGCGIQVPQVWEQMQLRCTSLFRLASPEVSSLANVAVWPCMCRCWCLAGSNTSEGWVGYRGGMATSPLLIKKSPHFQNDRCGIWNWACRRRKVSILTWVFCSW